MVDCWVPAVVREENGPETGRYRRKRKRKMEVEEAKESKRERDLSLSSTFFSTSNTHDFTGGKATSLYVWMVGGSFVLYFDGGPACSDSRGDTKRSHQTHAKE